MNTQLCSRCKKNVAVVFIQRLDGSGNSTTEGLCLKCASELGIKPVDDFLQKMGIDGDDLNNVSEEMMSAMGIQPPESDDDGDEPGNEGRAPSFDISGFFKNLRNKNEEQENDSDAELKKKAKNAANEKKRKNLEAFCVNLTKKAANGEIDEVIGRETELERIMQILCRRQKNNPCLIGDPGVGKTAVAEALALRIASGNVPHKLKSKEVYLVDMTAIVAGTQFRGQFENRMKGLIEEVKKLGNIILVIDEVHSIVAAGDAEGGMNAANILKPALSRGEIQVIGATTLAEYRKYIEKDAALERRFQPVIIREPSISDTVKILKGIKKYYEKFHGIKIPDETIEKTVTLSERYITDRYLPDKAIDLLDEAASFVALNDSCIEKLAEKRDELEKVKAEHSAAENNTDLPDEERFRIMAELKAKQLALESECAQLEGECDKVTLRPEHLAKVIEIWTGIPASTINENEFIRIDKLEERLKTRIIGQDKAVAAVAKAIKRSRAGIAAKKKPVSFIFAGPTGVGKTELVKTLAADLFDSPESLIRLDMSEFMEKHSVSRIIGAPPGYVGYDEAGQLTEKIRRRPYSVVLFDEIEKAHPDVLNILLQILDDGRITDAHGKVVNFENTMLVLTTNAGSSTGMNAAGFSKTEEDISEDRIMNALNAFLRPEFINRIDEIIFFRRLTKEDFKSIAAIMLGDLRKSLAEKNIAFSYSDDALGFIADKSYSVKYGARNLRRFIQTEVEDRIAELVIASYDEKIDSLRLELENGELCVRK